MASSSKIDGRRYFTAAKTNLPRLPKILGRPDCIQFLQKAADHKIIYISGRAGQGKTTLALSWLKETKTKSAWITLDEGDNDPIGFFRLLGDAFSAAFPRIRFELPSIPAGAPFEPSTFARTYFNRLMMQGRGRYVIVLDDFHALNEGGPLPAVIEALIEALPPKVQLVLLSRRLPAPFLSKWIASRQLFSLTEETLQFSVKEVEMLFTQVFDKPITASQAESLQSVMEGWITGLILFNEGNRGAPEWTRLKSPLKIGSGDRIFDYLYHEVYRRLDPALRAMMIRSALADSFSIESASRLMPGTDAGAQIRFLLGHHLLSEISAGDQVRFRYHPLLRQFLQGQAQTLPAAERRALIDQVGAALEEEGAVDQAVQLYLEFGHNDHAVRLIHSVGLAYTLEGKRHLLQHWIRSLPATALDHHPWLRFFLASDLALSNFREALESYQLALAGFERKADIEGELWTRSALIMLAIYSGNDFRLIKAQVKRGEQILQGSDGSVQARASFLLSDAFSGLAATDTPQHSLRKSLAAADLARQSGSNILAVRALNRAAFCACYLGKHRKARSLFEQSEAILSWHKLNPSIRTEALIYRGLVETYCGEKVLSRQYLLEAERLCLDFGLMAQIPTAQAHLFWNQVTLGEQVEADPSLESIRRRILAAGNFLYAAILSHSQALLCLEASDLSQALRHEEEALDLAQRCHTRFLLLIPLSILGAIWRELGELKKAEKYLRRALAGFERAGSDMFCFMAHLHLSKLSLDRGDEKNAKTNLTQALEYGKNESYLVAEGVRSKMMTPLLSRAHQWKLEPAYVQKLMDFWQVRPVPPLKIHTLGRFEVILNGKQIIEAAWHGKKAQLLLIALISLGGNETPKEAIMDLLWPDADGDRAAISFHTTLHRLQSVFGTFGKEGGLIQLSNGRVSFKAGSCWSDCWAFEEAVRLARRAEAAAKWSEAQRYIKEAESLYRGDYLPMFQGDHWVDGKRQKLRAQFEWVEHRLRPLR